MKGKGAACLFCVTSKFYFGLGAKRERGRYACVHVHREIERQKTACYDWKDCYSQQKRADPQCVEKKKKRKRLPSMEATKAWSDLFRPLPKGVFFSTFLEGDFVRDFADLVCHGLEVWDVRVRIYLEDDVASLAHVHVCGHRSEVSLKTDGALGEIDNQSHTSPRLAYKGEASTVGSNKNAVGEHVRSKNGGVRYLWKIGQSSVKSIKAVLKQV